MKTISLQETSTSDLIAMAREATNQGPAVLEWEGQAVAILLPMADYAAFQTWQATHKSHAKPPAQFEAEVVAFEALKPTLLAHYPKRVVAIYQGQVVEVGDDKMEVLERVMAKLGAVPCYIEWVEPDAPRQVRVPSVRVASL